MVRTVLVSCLLVLAILSFLASAADDECVYTVYVRTGSVLKASTDATIGLTLGDAGGHEFSVQNLEAWGGLMGAGHDYFERGALDVFSSRGPCGLDPPLCRLNLTSNGARRHDGWYCEYVEVTATGPHALWAQTIFYVNQWLATDAPPYRLYAIVDECAQPEAAASWSDHCRLVVGDSAEHHDADSSSY